MTTTPSLEQTRAAFEAWRSQRSHPTARIPDALRQAAVSLLDRYSIAEVCAALELRSTRLRKLQGELSASGSQPSSASPAFVELPAAGFPLPALSRSPEPACRLVLDRPDGSRLSLSIPAADLHHFDALLASLLRS